MIRVKLFLGNNQERLAQLYVGTAARTRRLPLTEFSLEMQAVLAKIEPDSEVLCLPDDNPTPASVKPDPDQPAATRPFARPTEALSSAAKPGSFPRNTGAVGPLERNPYNFAEWEDCPFPPLDNDRAAITHDQWHQERLSGLISVRLTARTPLFIPEGDVRKNAERSVPLRFWHCRDASGRDCLAIPGSSVKGAMRTLFETWTNSRLTVVNESLYEQPVPYRRRTAQLWVVVDASPDGSRRLRKCDVHFAAPSGATWTLRSKQPAPPETPPPASAVRAPTTIDPKITGWQVVRYRGNLLWTPDHKHTWTHLLVRVTPTGATLTADLVKRYQEFVDRSQAVDNHLDRVNDIIKGGPGRNYYLDVVAEKRAMAKRKDELRRLEVGDWIFGIPESTGPTGAPVKLECFGKNVNFMFPSAKSPKMLAGKFWPVEETAQREDADTTQTIFGFAGAYNKGGEPFRGRVRVGTFWAADGTQPLSPVQLKALTSPTGLKLKARSLYLPPAPDGITQTYDEAQRLRGRKFYWHQRGADNRVAADQTTPSPDRQCPPPIAPMPAGAVFDGEIHFDNLSTIEVGALLTSVCPGLLLGTDGGPAYGWKIGKGKPRGLGSVLPEVTALRLRPSDIAASYRTLDSEPVVAESKVRIHDLVSEFGEWLDGRARDAKRLSLSFVADLERLLRLPDGPQAHNYAEIKVIAGDPPKFDSATGDAHADPKVGRNLRPRAMRRARDIRF
jgi:hypothetical protein